MEGEAAKLTEAIAGLKKVWISLLATQFAANLLLAVVVAGAVERVGVAGNFFAALTLGEKVLASGLVVVIVVVGVSFFLFTKKANSLIQQYKKLCI